MDNNHANLDKLSIEELSTLMQKCGEKIIIKKKQESDLSFCEKTNINDKLYSLDEEQYTDIPGIGDKRIRYFDYLIMNGKLDILKKYESGEIKSIINVKRKLSPFYFILYFIENNPVKTKGLEILKLLSCGWNMPKLSRKCFDIIADMKYFDGFEDFIEIYINNRQEQGYRDVLSYDGNKVTYCSLLAFIFKIIKNRITLGFLKRIFANSEKIDMKILASINHFWLIKIDEKDKNEILLFLFNNSSKDINSAFTSIMVDEYKSSGPIFNIMLDMLDNEEKLIKIIMHISKKYGRSENIINLSRILVEKYDNNYSESNKPQKLKDSKLIQLLIKDIEEYATVVDQDVDIDVILYLYEVIFIFI